MGVNLYNGASPNNFNGNNANEFDSNATNNSLNNNVNNDNNGSRPDSYYLEYLIIFTKLSINE